MRALSADRASTDPRDDLFGHAPFAEQLAKSICTHDVEDGIVLALHGPWGAGKTTVLGYVQHYIEPNDSTESEKPIVVHFNPWWFSGREDLAHAFLGQLQAVLPAKNEKLERLGSLLGEFSESVGSILDLTGWTGGIGEKLGVFIGKVAKKEPKDIPGLKARIVNVLREARVRILVIIDDIDRLDDSEVRQVFTVIKALADFPFVTYLLAFDREAASRAIEQDSALPGERYLEKIIQVPFELPPVDKVSLRSALFKRLDEAMTGTPEGMFDHAYWTNVYFEGIDPLIRVPRDVVRFTNTLSITYPAVVGEVNPVDFIAIEAIRVFMPNLYDTIRSNQDKFAGHSRDMGAAAEVGEPQGICEQLTNELPAEWRTSTKDLLARLFPKIGDMGYGPDWLPEWRKYLRICHPDLFPIYFRLSLPSGYISRNEMDEFIDSIRTSQVFKEYLLRAKEEKRPDGTTRARALLERLMDHIESDIPTEHISIAVEALLDVGDDLIISSDEQGMFDFGNEPRVTRPVYHLLKRLDAGNRANVLTNAVRAGRGIGVQAWLLKALEDEFEKEQKSGQPSLLNRDEVERLKSVWAERVRTLSNEPDFVKNPQLRRILTAWRLWADGEEVRAWCRQMTETNDGLLRFIYGFLQHTRAQTMGDYTVRLQPRLNPAWLEHYLDKDPCAERLSRLREGGEVPEWATVAVSQFMKEYDMLKRGKDPDAIDAFDNEDEAT